MTNYTQVNIEVSDELQKDLLIAVLANAGFEGFEESGAVLVAFIPVDRISEEELLALLQPFETKYSLLTVAQQNWNEIWESSFEPVHIGDFCSIRAAFHAPETGFTHEIVITPKMSFGTGHHATTYLMIDSMQEIDFNGKTVLDFGTGTGVLAILAEKMGAAAVYAIDIDEWSITNAAENIEANHAGKITLQQNDAITTADLFDIILANINRNIILSHLPSIRSHLKPGGTLLLSGLLTSDQEEVVEAVTAAGLVFKEANERENWISLGFTDPED